MSALEDAAVAYVDAKLAHESAAGTPSFLAYELELDGAFHELVILCGRCTCEVTA